MSAKLTVNGIEIVIPTNELGEAIRQLSSLQGNETRAVPSKAPTEAPDAMTRPDSTPAPAQQQTPSRAYQMLKFISDASGSGGASATALMPVLGTTHIQGVGSRTGQVNAELKAAGFEVDQVYVKTRSADGVLHWRSGPRIEEALDALSKK